jgi:tetratricopeptide (TPR) repeat protein
LCLRKYDEAIVNFKKCLGLTPRNPQTLIAIGFVHALQGNYGQAIEYLHQVMTFFVFHRKDYFVFVRVFG